MLDIKHITEIISNIKKENIYSSLDLFLFIENLKNSNVKITIEKNDFPKYDVNTNEVSISSEDILYLEKTIMSKDINPICKYLFNKDISGQELISMTLSQIYKSKINFINNANIKDPYILQYMIYQNDSSFFNIVNIDKYIEILKNDKTYDLYNIVLRSPAINKTDDILNFFNYFKSNNVKVTSQTFNSLSINKNIDYKKVFEPIKNDINPEHVSNVYFSFSYLLYDIGIISKEELIKKVNNDISSNNIMQNIVKTNPVDDFESIKKYYDIIKGDLSLEDNILKILIKIKKYCNKVEGHKDLILTIINKITDKQKAKDYFIQFINNDIFTYTEFKNQFHSISDKDIITMLSIKYADAIDFFLDNSDSIPLTKDLILKLCAINIDKVGVFLSENLSKINMIYPDFFNNLLQKYYSKELYNNYFFNYSLKNIKNIDFDKSSEHPLSIAIKYKNHKKTIESIINGLTIDISKILTKKSDLKSFFEYCKEKSIKLDGDFLSNLSIEAFADNYESIIKIIFSETARDIYLDKYMELKTNVINTSFLKEVLLTGASIDDIIKISEGKLIKWDRKDFDIGRINFIESLNKRTDGIKFFDNLIEKYPVDHPNIKNIFHPDWKRGLFTESQQLSFLPFFQKYYEKGGFFNIVGNITEIIKKIDKFTEREINPFIFNQVSNLSFINYKELNQEENDIINTKIKNKELLFDVTSTNGIVEVLINLKTNSGFITNKIEFDTNTGKTYFVHKKLRKEVLFKDNPHIIKLPNEVLEKIEEKIRNTYKEKIPYVSKDPCFDMKDLIRLNRFPTLDSPKGELDFLYTLNKDIVETIPNISKNARTDLYIAFNIPITKKTKEIISNLTLDYIPNFFFWTKYIKNVDVLYNIFLKYSCFNVVKLSTENDSIFDILNSKIDDFNIVKDLVDIFKDDSIIEHKLCREDIFIDTFNMYKELKKCYLGKESIFDKDLLSQTRYKTYDELIKRLKVSNFQQMHNTLSIISNKAIKADIEFTYEPEINFLKENNSTYKAIIPENSNELKYIGQVMNICVGSYSPYVDKGNIVIVYIEKDEKPIICLELKRDMKTIVQAKCYDNELPVAETYYILQDYVLKKGLKIKTEDFSLNLKEIDPNVLFKYKLDLKESTKTLYEKRNNETLSLIEDSINDVILNANINHENNFLSEI